MAGDGDRKRVEGLRRPPSPGSEASVTTEPTPVVTGGGVVGERRALAVVGDHPNCVLTALPRLQGGSATVRRPPAGVGSLAQETMSLRSEEPPSSFPGSAGGGLVEGGTRTTVTTGCDYSQLPPVSGVTLGSRDGSTSVES